MPTHEAVPVVLIVDDDPTLRMVASAHLRQSGYAVATANDGAQALAVLDELDPQLILLDVDMPVMDGFTLCETLRQESRWQSLPVLMMTGLEGDHSIARAYEAGATDFIPKPVNWTLLKQRLQFLFRAIAAMDSLVVSEAHLAKAQAIAKLGYWRWQHTDDVLVLSEALQRLLRIKGGGLFTVTALRERRKPGTDSLLVDFASQLPAEAAMLPDRLEMRLGSESAPLICQIQTEKHWDPHGELLAVEGTLQDITEQRLAEQQIHYLSCFDSLTGLSNRESFTRELERMLSQGKLEVNRAALVLVNIDRFGRINDIFGHQTGDKTLSVLGGRFSGFAERLGLPIEHPGLLHCCRWGGDIFAVVASSHMLQSQHELLAQRLLDMVSDTVSVHGHELSLTASVGYAMITGSNMDLEILVRNAENAMRHAKRQGRNLIRCYDPQMDEATERRMLLEQELGKALANQQLRLLYQPRVSAKGHHIVAAEALLRWRHPVIGDVSPAEFIPLMEELGLIHEVGQWVLQCACLQLKHWNEQGYPDLVVSVNISGVQFRDVRLADQIAAVIEQTGVCAANLEVELTETAIMEDVAQTQQTLASLKALGLRVSVDDFGTGYSSLSYLRSFPLDALKVDRAFVRELPVNSDDQSLTSAIIAMARSLNLRVVAEGVEFEAQARFLLNKQCDELQGFYFSRPVDAHVLEHLLSQGTVLES